MWEKKGGKKILIVDDEEDFTKLIKLNLERTGKYEVKTENQGAFGFTTAKAFKPDLILLDILLPDAEGSEVASQLKDDEATRNIPIVFLTAIIAKQEVKESGGVIGGHPFISKPVDIKQLIEVIDKNIS
ncbi:MAG: response regulator [Candidatus Omnitrophica bacterium]|nr:response regulator [Candidatus Omnitrophota bacterium]